MRKMNFSAPVCLAIGIVLSTMGILMLVNQPAVISLFSNILPSSEIIQAFGIIFQFSGEALIFFGIVSAISRKATANVEYKSQVLVTGISENLKKEISGVAHNMQNEIAMLNNRLNKIQIQNTVKPQFLFPSNCKFCGAKIEQSHFCPLCRKSQD